MRKLIVLGSLMLLLGTLAAGQQTKKKDGKAATSKTEAAGNVNAQIDQLRDAWVAAFNSKDAAKVADLYTSDAVYLTPGGTVRDAPPSRQRSSSRSRKASTMRRSRAGAGSIPGTLFMTPGRTRRCPRMAKPSGAITWW